jgi:hypothetical protein
METSATLIPRRELYSSLASAWMFVAFALAPTFHRYHQESSTAGLNQAAVISLFVSSPVKISPSGRDLPPRLSTWLTSS